MRTGAWISLAIVHALTGCSSDSSDGDPFAQGGSSGAGVTGGKAGVTGGAPATTGGATTTTGGSSATTGGAPNPTGGASTATGGAPLGGSAGNGGSTTGGLGAGGATSGGSGGAGKGGGANGGAAGAQAGGSGGGAMDPESFFAATCATCHGARGEGKAMFGPEIQHPVRDFATWVVRNGRMGHPDFKSSVMAAYTEAALPKATLDGIFDWLSTPALPKPTTGEALFKDFCANCHAADGSGGAAAHGITDAPKTEISELVRQGHGGTQYSKRTGYMPKWSTTELTDAELDLIYGHLQTL